MSATVSINSLSASREGIIQLLRSGERAAAEDLAASLGVSKQCVRKHLDILERDGYITHAPERGERGRPAHVYRLTAKAETLFPKRYDLLAKSVLRQVSHAWGESGLNQVFCGCAEELIGALRPQLSGLAFDERVRRLAELLNQAGCEAAAEKQSDGSYLLTEGNCPVADVAREYAQLCDRELRVYGELLRAEVTRETRIAAGDARCTYLVRRPSAEEEKSRKE